MKQEDRKSLASVIEAHTQRLSINELAARGKQHVRVISGERAMALIEAVVDDTISRRAGEVALEDKERIVREAQDAFQRVARIQAEAEGIIANQKELLASQAARLKELEAARADAERRVEAAQRDRTERDRGAGRLEQSLEEARRLLQEVGLREEKAARALRQMERRLSNARETIVNYDSEIERLSTQVKQDAALIEELERAVHSRDEDANRLKGVLETLEGEVRAARGKGADSETVQALRGEIGEMREYLKSLESRSGQADRATVEALLARLAEKETTSAARMEETFRASMSETLDKLDKTLRGATARPLDRAVEATDVVVARLFDEDDKMESNLQRLEAKVLDAKEGIHKSLDRLRELRQRASGLEGRIEDEAEPAQPSA